MEHVAFSLSLKNRKRSKFIKHHFRAKTRAPAYSPANKFSNFLHIKSNSARFLIANGQYNRPTRGHPECARFALGTVATRLKINIK